MTDREQLLHLADRARRGVALPAEHDALTAGITAMANRLEDWKQAAGAGMTLTDNLRAERDALAAGVPLICSDDRHKTKVFALEIHAAKAEAERDRVQQAACSNAETLRHAEGRVVELEAAIARVQAVHRPTDYRHTRICVACSGYYDSSCDNGMHEWPCATAEALDQPQPEGAEAPLNP